MAAHAPRLELAEEAALLDTIQKGTQIERDAAYERIFTALREPVYALCLRLTGNAVDAEDALQDCFIAAFRGLSLFRGDARISSWLYRIAVREALRHKKRHGANEPRITVEPAAPETLNPAVHRERFEMLNDALDRISAEHRTVLAMFALEGLSHEEIAMVLKIPTGTVWSRLHKARKKLAEELKTLEQQPRPGPRALAVQPKRPVGKRRSLGTGVLLRGLVRRASSAWPLLLDVVASLLSPWVLPRPGPGPFLNARTLVRRKP